MNSKTIVALAALEQKLDTILFAREDEQDHTGRNIAAAGAGTVAVGGSVLADRTVMKRYGQRGLLGSGEIKPGTPLAEPVLAQQFGASRAPVREALIALERDGLVEFNERSRTRVRLLTVEDFQALLEVSL